MATANLKHIHTILKDWAQRAVDEYDSKAVFLFGSLIYKDGDQFMASSDVDLVVVIPELGSAIERWRWLQRFAEWVGELESRLLRALKRSGFEPAVSVVAVTEAELAFNVHKDGHREFFTSNVFRDLVTDVEAEGLPGAGSSSTDRFVAGAFSFAQKFRNDFLSVSANGTPKLGDYDGADPIPKRIMRAAAMAARASGRTGGSGAEHDVQEGLDLLTHELYARREDDPAYRSLQDLVSVHRNARGQSRPVDPPSQLLLAEMIYDLAATPGQHKAEPRGEDGTLAQPQGAGRAVTEKDSGAVVKEGYGVEGKPAGPAGRIAVERMGSSTSFFAKRFAASFPGARSISWFDDPGDIEQRMVALLQSPLTFPDGLPVWYWRGGNLQIESFSRLAPGLFLMDSDELRISRVAAVHGSTYQRHFVYVRCEAMEPTGLYRTSISDVDAALRQNGFDYEEYGLVSGVTPVKRSEYDDGAAVIDGQLMDIRGRSELRVRYTTPYNFLIASNGSPINNNSFDDVLVTQLNEALISDDKEKAAIERLRALVAGLPLRGGQYD